MVIFLDLATPSFGTPTPITEKHESTYKKRKIVEKHKTLGITDEENRSRYRK